jgi:putative transposase
VTARGNERKAIYRQDSARAHFLELLSEVAEGFSIRVHAYVPMDNHYHLLIEIPHSSKSGSKLTALQTLRAMGVAVPKGASGSGG